VLPILAAATDAAGSRSASSVQSRRVASIDGEIPADNATVTAASAGSPSESDTSTASTSTTVAADLHRPIPMATG
ncbi:MAG: hypothetical protein WA645_09515, partial [Pseudolabrys sp.]